MNNSHLEVLRRANILYFRSGVYNQTEWMGVKVAKCPMDMWVYQELIFGLKPRLIIETGTWLGGSALYFAQLLDMMDTDARVVSIDIDPPEALPQHPRIDWLTGSSTSPEVIAQLDAMYQPGESCLVILDSDHRYEHKLEELRLYRKYVPPGGYMIAEDSCFDHFPAWPEFGPGPAAAINAFLAEDKDFEADRSQERHMITFAPRAFLRRRSPQDR